MSSWFDVNPSIVGNIYEAKIIKILHGGIVRARLKNDIIVSVRGVPKSYKVNSVVKIIIVSEEFDDKPVHCLLYTSPSPRDAHESRMPSSA